MSQQRELEDRGIGEDRPEFQYYLGLVEAETVEHLFWECGFVQGLIQQCVKWLCNDNEKAIGRDSFMLGCLADKKMITVCDVVWKHYVKFFVYKSRKRKVIPRFGNLRYEMEGFGGTTGKLGWMEYRFWLRDMLEGV